MNSNTDHTGSLEINRSHWNEYKTKIDDTGERARQSPGQNSWVHKRDGF